MRPFLELPIVITNSEGEERQVINRIQPDEIEYYYPGLHTGTVFVMKSRSSFITILSTDEVDAALSAYHTAIKSNSGRFGNLKITPKSKIHVAN